MPPITGIGNPPSVLSLAGSGHGDHGANAAAPTTSTQSFSTTLAKVINPASGASARGAHGGDLQEIALELRAYRQQLIASNIANADTPGYKAVDIDFQEALRIARSVANTPPLKLSATHSGHILGRTEFSLPSYSLKYHIPSQTSLDGNTVEMDVERSKFAENSMMWEFARDRVSGHYKHMMEMLQSLKD